MTEASHFFFFLVFLLFSFPDAWLLSRTPSKGQRVPQGSSSLRRQPYTHCGRIASCTHVRQSVCVFGDPPPEVCRCRCYIGDTPLLALTLPLIIIINIINTIFILRSLEQCNRKTHNDKNKTKPCFTELAASPRLVPGQARSAQSHGAHTHPYTARSRHNYHYTHVRLHNAFPNSPSGGDAREHTCLLARLI